MGGRLEGSDQENKLVFKFSVFELVEIDKSLHFFHFFEI